MGFLDRLKHAWNAFSGKGNETYAYFNPKVDYGYSSYSRPDRVYMSRGNERSIVTAVYNRIAMDVASVVIKHVRLDENGRYIKEIKSS